MHTEIANRYELIAGHWLPKVPEGHKCSRPHGHNYMVDIIVGGAVGENGFIVDFFDLDRAVKPLLERLDHRMLNDVAGLENPTAENIAAWMLNELDGKVPFGAMVVSVKVWETPTCYAVVRA